MLTDSLAYVAPDSLPPGLAERARTFPPPPFPVEDLERSMYAGSGDRPDLWVRDAAYVAILACAWAVGQYVGVWGNASHESGERVGWVRVAVTGSGAA